MPQFRKRRSSARKASLAICQSTRSFRGEGAKVSALSACPNARSGSCAERISASMPSWPPRSVLINIGSDNVLYILLNTILWQLRRHADYWIFVRQRAYNTQPAPLGPSGFCRAPQAVWKYPNLGRSEATRRTLRLLRMLFWKPLQ